MEITIFTDKTIVKKGERLAVKVDWRNEVRAWASVNLYQGINNIAWNSTQLRDPGTYTDGLDIIIPVSAIEQTDLLYGALVDEAGNITWSNSISIVVSGTVVSPWYKSPLVIGAGIFTAIAIMLRKKKYVA